MKRSTKLLATVAAIGTMAVAAVPATSEAASPGDFSAVCGALGLPSSAVPINLGALGGLTLTTCTAAILGNDPCPGPQIPLNYLLPGILGLKGTICIGL